MSLPGVRQIERAGLKAWPAVENEPDGSWVRRAAGGHTKRANSVQCLDPADDGNLSPRIEASRRWFAARGIEPTFRITALAGPGLRAELERSGWEAFDFSATLAMNLGGQTLPESAAALLVAPADPAWLAAQRMLQGYDAATTARLAAIIAVLAVPAIGVVLPTAAGPPAASALFALADGIVIAGNVVAAPAERGKGLATAVMRAGLAWARRHGAVAAAVNVVADNRPALALYARLGFRHVSDYHYRRPVRP